MATLLTGPYDLCILPILKRNITKFYNTSTISLQVTGYRMPVVGCFCTRLIANLIPKCSDEFMLYPLSSVAQTMSNSSLSHQHVLA